jgi:hypothetical protein
MSPPKPLDRWVLLLFTGFSTLWSALGIRHALFGKVSSQVPSIGYFVTAALSLAAPFIYRRVHDFRRHGFTALLVAATMFCVLLAAIDVAVGYFVSSRELQRHEHLSRTSTVRLDDARDVAHQTRGHERLAHPLHGA